MDYRLPDGDGATATAQILEKWPEVKVIMLSGIGGNDLLARAIEGRLRRLDREGPTGERRRRSDPIGRSRRVRASCKRASATCSVGYALHPRTTHRSSQSASSRVLRLVAKAHATDEIAAELFLSVHTVRNHVSNVLTKLGAHSKLEAVAIAARTD